MVLIKMRYFIYLSISVLVLASSSKNANAADAHLSISPESCMAKEGWCETTLKVRWQLAAPIDTCLKFSDRKALQCFNALEKPSTEIEIKTNQKLTIELLHGKTKKVMASSSLNVFVKEYEKRRRQRHAWSVIL